MELLKELSNADAIASKENEIRNIIKREVADYDVEIIYDSLGSLVIKKNTTTKKPKKIMFAAHMDEVGFLVRHISHNGMIYVHPVGGVEDRSKEMQSVRVTTSKGTKIYGVLNVTKEADGSVKDMYVDVGVSSNQEISDLGIEIGDMCCFASDSKTTGLGSTVMGKAMDDRSGCYTLLLAMEKICKKASEFELYFAFTSSEEVGTRGGNLVTQQFTPDLFFAIDVANHPELDQGFKNHRKLDKGPMIVHYDKTLAPNTQLLQKVKQIANEHSIAYQSDMFSGGGTDAGIAHLVSGGRLSLVLGIPLRYCHGSYSLVHINDLKRLAELITYICIDLSTSELEKLKEF